MLGGPPGVFAGAAVGAGLGVGLKRIAIELHERVLGPREQARTGATLTYAVTAAKERLDTGEQLRTDGFFEMPPDPTDRSAADEVIEGILISGQREYEERKLALYGELLASIAFRTDISRAHANYLIREVEALSYRELCLLAMACRGALPSPSLNGIALEDARASEIADLYRRHLIRTDPSDTSQLAAWSNGQLLCELLGLDKLGDEEISRVSAISMSRQIFDSASAPDSLNR